MRAEATPAQSSRSGREAQLWRAFKDRGAASAREQLFSLYIGLARKIARRHSRNRDDRTVEFPDLCQLAYAGLLEAIDRYDPDYGVSFAHYAERRIAGSVLDGVRQASERHEQLAFRQRVRRERSRSLAGADVDALTPDEALDRLVDAAVGLALGFMLEGVDIYVADGAVDQRPNAYESTAWRELMRKVMAKVDALPERERLIIRQHYMEGVDFDHLGTLLRVSKGRVSQLHRDALTLLKKQLDSVDPFNPDR